MYPSLPMRLVDIRGDEGIIDTGEDRYPIHLHFLDSVNVGDCVLVQLGFAVQLVERQSLSPKPNTTIAALRSEIEKQLAGSDFTVLLTSGTQIASLQLNGIRYTLPPNLHFAFGPGCPTCLTPVGYYRSVFELAQRESTIVVTFSDVVNMPTPGGTLHSLRMAGNDVRVVHSPYDVLRIAEWNPSKEVILAAVGYDIMAATVGITLKEAIHREIRNLSLFSSLHKRDVFLREYIFQSERTIDGVVCSPHDATVEGINSYKFIVQELNRAFSCVGFTAEEVLSGVVDIIRQVKTKKLTMHHGSECNCLKAGNTRLRSTINDVFTVSDNRWSSGKIAGQGKYILCEKFQDFDAIKKFDIQPDELLTMSGCSGRDIQLGLKLPLECPMFAKHCNPANPVGAAMISSDGLCHTWYHSSHKFKLQNNE